MAIYSASIDSLVIWLSEVTNKRIVRLGKRIRQLRSARGLSQEELANLTKIDRSYMGGIERGEHNTTMRKFLQICDTLEMTPSEVFEDFDMSDQ